MNTELRTLQDLRARYHQALQRQDRTARVTALDLELAIEENAAPEVIQTIESKLRRHNDAIALTKERIQSVERRILKATTGKGKDKP